MQRDEAGSVGRLALFAGLLAVFYLALDRFAAVVQQGGQISQRVGFGAPIATPTLDRQRLLVVLPRVVQLSQRLEDEAQIGQAHALLPLVAELTSDRQSLLVESARLIQAAQVVNEDGVGVERPSAVRRLHSAQALDGLLEVRASLFLAATLGVSQVDITTPGYDSDSFFSFSLGLGFQVAPTNRLGLRLEARGYGTLLDSSSDLFCQFGPSNNVCVVRIDGTIMWQVEALAGIVFRF